jgi:DNA-directed RNA polymerase specialized sigma24 family protein
MANKPQTGAVLLGLQGYLTRIAGHLASQYGTSAEELLSQMNLYLAERAHQDPGFLQQAPGYITRAAAWRARDWMRSQRRERCTSFDAIEQVLYAPAPDLDLGLAVRDALAGLCETDRQIAGMLASGYERKEIAQRLGYSSSSALWRALARIRAALTPALAGA